MFDALLSAAAPWRPNTEIGNEALCMYVYRLQQTCWVLDVVGCHRGSVEGGHVCK